MFALDRCEIECAGLVFRHTWRINPIESYKFIYKNIVKDWRVIMNKYIFPVTLIILDICAAAVYGFNGDIKKLIYWLAAATLSITVTF